MWILLHPSNQNGHFPEFHDGNITTKMDAVTVWAWRAVGVYGLDVHTYIIDFLLIEGCRTLSSDRTGLAVAKNRNRLASDRDEPVRYSMELG